MTSNVSFMALFVVLVLPVAGVSPEPAPTAADLVFFNQSHLSRVKTAIDAKDPFFLERYVELLAESDRLLAKAPDPVVNKTVIPPSRDKHDYVSYAPYRWLDETKKDGLPWKAIDGVTNPIARGKDTDYTRLVDFSESLEKLSFAWYFSGEAKYADKGIELLRVWFIDPETRVNPNLNYTQGVPGVADGRPAGILEWARISKVVTAVQLFEEGGVLPHDIQTGIRDWMEIYLEWLLNDKLGKEADLLPQNHANCYNYQVVGLMLYLGRNDDAKARVEAAKTSRIAAQITPDGGQPLELGRTKSIHYSTMNLWSLANLTFMGRKLGVDLWDFETTDGRSLPKAYAFLMPFAQGVENWPYKQITPGGAKAAIETELKPFFSKSATLLEIDSLDKGVEGVSNLSALESLQYPPLGKLVHFKAHAK